MHPRFIRPGLVAAVIMSAAFAPASAAEKKPATASFRFLRFSELPPMCVRAASGKFVPVEANTGFIGGPVRLSLKTPADICRADDTGEPLRDGDKLRPPLVTFPVLGDPRQIVVLLGEEKAIRAHVIPDNPVKFPYGRILAVNLTGDRYHAEVGGAATELPPGRATLCPAPKTLSASNDVAVTLRPAVRTPVAEPDPVYSSVWMHSTEVRRIAFIYKNAAGRLVVRIVRDANVPETAEAEPEKQPAGKPVK